VRVFVRVVGEHKVGRQRAGEKAAGVRKGIPTTKNREITSVQIPSEKKTSGGRQTMKKQPHKGRRKAGRKRGGGLSTGVKQNELE